MKENKLLILIVSERGVGRVESSRIDIKSMSITKKLIINITIITSNIRSASTSTHQYQHQHQFDQHQYK